MIGINGPGYDRIAGRKTYDVISAYAEHLSPSRDQVMEWVHFKQVRARQYLATGDILYDDSLICLRTLVNLQIRVALGTSASRGSTDTIVKRLGFAPFLSVVVTGDDVEAGKPAPDVYLRAMALAGIASDRTLIIEDSEPGLQAALASGAYAASVRTMETTEHPRFVGRFPDLHGVLAAAGIGAP
jgi:HAD superfamily hydrolase (TIGR01509 family)